ncbi:MAG: YcaO-like family protein [Eubacteriales bacterium]|nr:YcaO-like family protein [Eubacteriales bacterium]
MDKAQIKGKDAKPLDTVNKITAILEKLNINTKHYFIEQSLEHCFSSRVYAEGELENYIGTNGKGTTEEYCLASGYAEFMERIQNAMFLYDAHIFDKALADELDQTNKNLNYCSWSELLVEEDSILNKYADLCAETIRDCPVWLKRSVAIEQLKSAFSYLENRIPTIPYFHTNAKRYEWIPDKILRFFFMSNGMAAGNTLEEALVQGYSEIFERIAQREIIAKQLTPPRIPEEVINRFPYVKGVVNDIEAAGPYKVIVCDCSLGRNIPAVCGIIVDTDTHTFGIRFGSHPNLGIALERVFTESLQGRNLEQFTKYSAAVFSEALEGSDQNIFNNMKIGAGFYPVSIFGSEPSYAFAEWDWDGNADNKALARRMSRKLEEDGYDVYIKDASSLGFPSVHIIVPGLSELRPCSQLYLKEFKLKVNVTDALIHIDDADERSVEQIIRYCKVIRNALLENTVNSLYALPLKMKFHGGGGEIDFLTAVCYYYLGNHLDAYRYMNLCRSRMHPDEEDYRYVSLAETLLHGLANQYDEGLIRDLLKSISDEATYGKLMEDFKEPKNILKKLYPHFKDFDEMKQRTDISAYRELSEFYRKIYQAQDADDAVLKRLHLLFNDN